MKKLFAVMMLSASNFTVAADFNVDQGKSRQFVRGNGITIAATTVSEVLKGGNHPNALMYEQGLLHGALLAGQIGGVVCLDTIKAKMLGYETIMRNVKEGVEMNQSGGTPYIKAAYDEAASLYPCK
ncbi:TPA: hypothetical protein RUX60_004464, partial [Aeromonas hydrophila]|nr:hypothetical protein [Aeromonas hydrophila]HDX9189435.1 hypothetical protein [Aeromonas hydrophila]HDZ8853446.1 hypothetical protein [Aeromonas hydrophila]HDZ8866701.1 hypothetical protein [Aeromonas hydrophila]HDZ8875865.1 hypothetical protein [Aeromonas hydrophila]